MTQKDTRAATALAFLAEVAQNNNRPWFEAHRDAYTEARASFESMVADLLPRIAEFDAGIGHLSVKDCTYRFYRDIRFSPDKSPYKRHFGAYINSHGKKSFHGGYYLHLQPGNSLLGGGAYCLSSPLLAAVRRDVMENISEFRGIVEANGFRRLFPVIGMDRVKTLPKGVRRDFPFPQYVRPKDYSVGCSLEDGFFNTADWLEKTVHAFKVMKPYLDFINFTIDEAQ